MALQLRLLQRGRHLDRRGRRRAAPVAPRGREARPLLINRNPAAPQHNASTHPSPSPQVGLDPLPPGRHDPYPL
jgi:hypothetical protein